MVCVERVWVNVEEAIGKYGKHAKCATVSHHSRFCCTHKITTKKPLP
jgi:hypothetical protein